MEQAKMENAVQNVIGLTLQLQKFGIGKTLQSGVQDSNMILGHYDYLSISKITRWLHYSPRMDWQNNGERRDSLHEVDKLVTHYPIKLLFPDKEMTDKLPQFKYEAWKEPEKLLKNAPCMTLVLLNLTDAYKEQAKKHGDLLQEFLCLLTGSSAEFLDDMYCCVLPSLGYSDFCVLMAGTSWKPAMELVEYLHGLTEGEQGTAVLSTDYMMPVCHRGEAGFQSTYFDGIELSVRVNLRPGTTAQQLAGCVPQKIKVHRTSGGSDCVLRAEDEQAQEALINFLLGKKDRNFVIDMASTLYLPVTSDPEAQKEVPEKGDFSAKNCISHFKEAIKKYEKKLNLHKRHLRQTSSLRELAADVSSVCAQPHTAALRVIMEDLIEAFSECLELCAENMDQEAWKFDEMEQEIGKFSGIVGSFLSDLSRSDCFFMEREKYNHASVSSATSILIAYNQWLNDFTDTVRSATQPGNESDYAFLVTSGGRDQTQTLNAFYFLDPTVRNGQLYERIPLVIQMSEMSLFDFSGTLMRSVHECMHFCGTRRREERVRYLLEFVNIMLSQLLANALLPDKMYHYVENILVKLSADKEELLRGIKAAYKECWENLAKAISVQLVSCFDFSATDEWTEKDYLARYVRDWIYDTLMGVFSGHEIVKEKDGQYILRPNRFAAQLYKLTQEAHRRYFEKCDQLCGKAGVATAIFAFEEKKQETLSQMSRDVRIETDLLLVEQIQMILSRLLITEPSGSMPNRKEQPNYTDWEHKFPYVTLVYRNIYSILAVATDIFTETFADVAACEIVGASLEDYLLMHVYEDWEPNSALEAGTANVYRISAVLRICFPDDLCEGNTRLSDEAQKHVEQCIERLKKHGMPGGRLDATALCQRIHELLKAFAANEDIGTPLLEYLRGCREDYAKKSVKKNLQRFSDSFHAVRLLSVEPEKDDTHRKLVGMYNALIDRGGDSCGGPEAEVPEMAEAE